MEEKRVLWVLVLLTSLPVAFAGVAESSCCDWTERAEWPLEAPHCPASLEGANATYCCGLCFTSHRCPFEEEAWLEPEECPAQDQEQYPFGEEHLPPLTSGSPSKESFWVSSLVLSLPSVFVLIFICVWLCLRAGRDNPEDDASSSGSTSSFVCSQLRSRCRPPRYGACSAAAPSDSALSPLIPQDSPSPSAETGVPFHEAASQRPEEDQVSLSPPAALREEAVSGDAPEMVSGDAQEPVLFHQATSETPGEEEEEEEEEGPSMSPPMALQEEPVSGDALAPVSGGAPALPAEKPMNPSCLEG